MGAPWLKYQSAAPAADAAAQAGPWQKYGAAAPTTGRGDLQPMAAGAVLHAMPADTISGGPPQASPSVASDIADSAASRYQAGLLDIPGMGGDLVGLANDAADAIAHPIVGGIRYLMGKPQLTPEQWATAQQQVDAKGTPLGFLPTSGDIKKAVGFQAYQPQTDTGKTFDKWGGGAVELVPSLMTGSGGGNLIKTALTQGVKTAAKKGAGDVLKYAVAPNVASEAAGEVTKGTPLEPIARLGAALVTGSAAGAKGAKVIGALTGDQWHAVADQAYADMKNAGIGVKPSAFDRMVSDAEQQLHAAGYRPALEGHGNVKTVLDEMKAAAGTPQSYQELDQMHRLAMSAAKSIHPDARRVAGMLADKIDNFMENLKPADLMSQGNPGVAFTALTKGRDAWRRMRTGERIDNMIEKAKDAAGANYTAAGLQTALKQQFRAFKWKGKAEMTPEFKRLSNEEKMLVNGIIGGNNALRLIGKFNFRNPVVAAMMGALGVGGSPALAAGALGIGEAARHLSAKGTLAKVDQLSTIVRGGKVTPRRWGRPPNAIFYGTAADREANKP